MYTNTYNVLAVHVEYETPERLKITVAIESSPGRFKAYERSGIPEYNIVFPGTFQEVAASGNKILAPASKQMFSGITMKYKYEQ